MQNKRFINRLQLKNFRCHPDGYIGPFARFNLIYGRNGSGKTSLLESIELVFTGTSYRLEKADDVKAATARDTNQDVSVRILDDNDQEIVSFKNNKIFPSKSRLLRTFYRIHTDGRKARFLLPQMFATHNLLYSERIIQFLSAGEKDQLRSVMSELTLGRVILDTWSYFVEANRTISSICDNFSEEFEKNEDEINDLKNALADIGADDVTRVQALAQRLESNLPPVFWEESKPERWEATSSCLTNLRDVAAKLEETKNHFIALRSFLELHDKPLTWNGFRDIIEKAKMSKKEVETELEVFGKNQESMNDKITSLEEEEETCASRSKEIQLDLKRLIMAITSTEHIIRWLPEMAARKKELSLIKSVQLGSQELANWEKALQLAEGLPETEKERALEQRINKLEKEQSEIKTRMARIEEERELYKSELDEIEKRLATTKSFQERVQNLVLQLHLQLKDIVELAPSNICPACGHDWPSFEDLKEAMEARLKALAVSAEVISILDSQDASSKVKLQKKLARLDESEKRYRNRLENQNQVLGRLQKKRIKTEAEWYELKNLLSELDFRLSIAKRDDLSNQLATLDKHLLIVKVQEIRKSQSRQEVKISQIWSGLRRKDFEKKEETLNEHIQSLQRVLWDNDLRKPSGWQHSHWEKLQRTLKALRDNKQEEHDRVEQTLAQKQKERRNWATKVKELGRKLISSKRTLQDIKKSLLEWSTAQNDVAALEALGLIDVSKSIEIQSLLNFVANLYRQVGALAEELSSQMKARQHSTRLENRLEEKTKQRMRDIRLLKEARELKNQLTGLSSPERFEKSIWDEYADVISSIFKRLHWPPDFEAVYLRSHKGNLELEVELREEQGRLEPAHQRLSAGQRSALALSAFWVFNTITKDIPPVLLMDEPVQSVDDLNILNFLDGLRWILEGADRQVFLTTASQRLQRLIRRKFSYLEDDFLEVHLMRDEGLSRVDYWKAEQVSPPVNSEKSSSVS